MLLRGLAVSLQFNVSVGELWKEHAEEAIERVGGSIELAAKLTEDAEAAAAAAAKKPARLIRRVTTKDLVDDLKEHTVKP